MLVALPAAIAFRVTIYSAISPHHAALECAGGLSAPPLLDDASTLGGTDRLISPYGYSAAAVLSALRFNTQQGVPRRQHRFTTLMLGILAGSFQILFGFVGIVATDKYIPIRSSAAISRVGLIGRAQIQQVSRCR